MKEITWRVLIRNIHNNTHTHTYKQDYHSPLSATQDQTFCVFHDSFIIQYASLLYNHYYYRVCFLTAIITMLMIPTSTRVTSTHNSFTQMRDSKTQ